MEEGIEWYQSHTKYPAEVCEMMARYEWGSLKYTTPKEFRNLKKKVRKKRKTQEVSLRVNRAPKGTQHQVVFG